MANLCTNVRHIGDCRNSALIQTCWDIVLNSQNFVNVYNSYQWNFTAIIVSTVEKNIKDTEGITLLHIHPVLMNTYFCSNGSISEGTYFDIQM